MASLTKRVYYVDPRTGKEVRRGTRGAVKRTSRFWRIRVLLPSGKVLSRRGYTDKAASQQLAAQLEKQAAQNEQGLVNPFRAQQVRPLSAHLDEFLAELADAGRDDMYVRVVGYRLRKLAQACRWSRLMDLTAESFVAWRGKQKASGKTLNDHLDAVRRLVNWAIKSKRLPAGNPFGTIERAPAPPTFVRRALTAEELSALYQVAPVYRQRVYAFAATTGLRRQEIMDLQWGDVVLDAPTPFLKLRAAATKARRADAFALKPEVAAMLRVMRAEEGEVETSQAVFRRVPEVQTLHRDLRAAGIALPAGLDRIDFHSLRTTLGSFIGRAGIPERVGMEMLRVTSPNLLRATYCDPRVLSTAAHIAQLGVPTPLVLAPQPAPEAQEGRATGTDDAATVVDSLPARVLNRTNDACRDLPPSAATGRMQVTVGGEQLMSWQGVVPRAAATGRDLPGGKNVPGMGFEPSGQAGVSSGNLKFPGAAGRKSDKPSMGEGEEGGLSPEILRDLERLRRALPRLTPAVRHAIVAMAEGAAKE